MSPSLLTDVDTIELLDQKISGFENVVTRLDSTTSKLKSSILELKTRRNSCAAISKLPAEILVEIMLEGGRLAQGQSIFAERGSLNIAGACQSWRAIAISTPHLWSSIDVTSVHPYGCLEMLRRSKSVPLHVRYAPQTQHLGIIQRYAASAAAVMSQLERIRTLEMTSPTGANPPFPHLPLRANVNASSLQVIRLTCPGSAAILMHCPWAMPSLRTLTLLNVTLGTNFPPLPASLTQLNIVSPSPYGGQPISHLLRCMQNAPSIETISVMGMVLDVPAAHPILAQKITLPKLSRLNIASPNISASTIFDYLQHPTSTCIHFTCPQGHFQQAELASIKRTISHFAVRGAVSTVSASITVAHNEQVEIIVDASQPRDPLPKRFKLKFPFSRPDMMDMAIKLWAAIPLADAPSLTVSGFFTDQLSSEWPRLFKLFRGVEVLRFTECDGDVLEGLLGADDAESLPLPMLRKIYFHQCGYEDDGPRPCDAMWNVMKQLLSERSELGIPIELYWDGVYILEKVENHSESLLLGRNANCGASKEKVVVNLEHCIVFI